MASDLEIRNFLRADCLQCTLRGRYTDAQNYYAALMFAVDEVDQTKIKILKIKKM